MELIVGALVLVAVLACLAGLAKHDAEENGCGCAGGGLLLFLIVFLVVIATATGSTALGQ